MREKPFILVVDDEDSFPEVICAKLNASGFETAHAKSRDEAMKKAEELMPDLILMDVQMPKVQGTDAALDLKQNEKTKDIKVAFLTSMKELGEGFTGAPTDVSKELGMEDFLQKTDDLDVLLEKIKKILAKPPVPTSESASAATPAPAPAPAPTPTAAV